MDGVEVDVKQRGDNLPITEPRGRALVARIPRRPSRFRAPFLGLAVMRAVLAVFYACQA